MPQPEAIEAQVCTVDGAEFVCLSPEATWALDRWLGSLHRWTELAAACPGVVIGESGVAEELDKLK